MIDNYNKYRQAAEVARKNSDPSLNDKRRDTSNKYSNERKQYYNNYVSNEHLSKNPYGDVGSYGSGAAGINNYINQPQR